MNIYFGNEKSSPTGKKYEGGLDQDRILLANNNIFVPNQVHGTNSFLITSNKDLDTWKMAAPQGDYLITNLPRIKIGVLTADCLPIVFYSQKKFVVAIAHAGWQGTVAGIADKVLCELKENFGKEILLDLKVYFGPSAQTCCYEVGSDFVKNLEDDDIAQLCIEKRKGRYFFDVSGYNMICLTKSGIALSNIDRQSSLCTICNFEFCSYRRHNKNTKLQLSTVSL